MSPNSLLRTLRVSLALILSLALPPNATAHADPILEQTLHQSDARQAAAYHQTQLYTQIGNHYRMLGEASSDAGYFKKAEAAFQELSPGYLRDHAAGHMANEYASAGLFEQANQLLESISEPVLRTHASWKVIAKQGKAGNKAGAAKMLALLETEIRKVQEPALLAELLTGTGAAYKVVDPAHGAPLVFEAYGLSQIIADPSARAKMLNELGANFIDIGRRDMAMHAFAKAGEIGAQLADPLARAQVYAMQGGELAEKSERIAAIPVLEKALMAAKQVSDKHDRAEVLSEIARNYGQSYQFESGLQVIDLIDDPYYQAEGYLRIGKNLWKNQRGDEARRLFEHTNALLARISHPVQKATLQRKLVSEWINLKDFERARKALALLVGMANKIAQRQPA